jgi:hypothetical protein
VIIRSIPNSAASFAWAVAVTPQSTVMMSYGFGIKPVSFVDAMRDIIFDLGAHKLQQMPQYRDTRYPVDVIIAVDGDPFAIGKRLFYPGNGSSGAGYFFRLNKFGKFGRQKTPCLFDGTYIAVDKYLREDR